MWTIAVVICLAIAWFGAQKQFEENPSFRRRRVRAALAWAILGAICGSYLGVVGFGEGIAGTIPGAVVAFMLASSLMNSNRLDGEKAESQAEPSIPSSVRAPLSPVERTAGIIKPSATSRKSPPENEANGRNYLPAHSEKKLSLEYGERVTHIAEQFRAGHLPLILANQTHSAELESAERASEAHVEGKWAPAYAVWEMERLQTWWWEVTADEHLNGGRSTFFSLVNTSSQPVGGLVVKFSDEGWAKGSVVKHTFHSISFSEVLAPLARAVVGIRIPIDLPWQHGRSVARADIVKVRFVN